jgi:O-antigen ligase
MQRITKYLPKENTERIIILLVVWQGLSVALMAIGTWPQSIALLNTALLAIFILLAKPYSSVLLLVISIPFYVALPNQFLPDLPMWRVLFVWLFMIWVMNLLIAQRSRLLKVFSITRWHKQSPFAGVDLKEILVASMRRTISRLMPWDKLAWLFLFLAVFSLLIARFPAHGLKQIIFLANIYLFYIVILNVVTDQAKLRTLIRYTMYSLAIMLGLGYAQYFATFFSQPYYFWQYWATSVSSLYYGLPLGNVLVYSNSWFSYVGDSQVLRMFGVMPDTHSFGVLCVFLLAYLAARAKPVTGWKVWTGQSWAVVVGLALSAFAIMASGTRGVWLTMLAPMAVAAVAYSRRLNHSLMRLMLVVYGLVIVLFLSSPLISQGLNLIRTVDVDDSFLSRAGSIYDLRESSNVGRLEIWRESSKFAALHPFGVGYGNFIVSLLHEIPADATFEQVSSMTNLRYNLPQKFITAHSLYLQLLVELGFAGLLAFALFWWEYFDRLWQFVKRTGQSFNQYTNLAQGLGLAMIWLLAYGIFDLTILNDRVLQYLFVSLAISGLIFVRYESFPDQSVE